MRRIATLAAASALAAGVLAAPAAAAPADGQGAAAGAAAGKAPAQTKQTDQNKQQEQRKGKGDAHRGKRHNRKRRHRHKRHRLRPIVSIRNVTRAHGRLYALQGQRIVVRGRVYHYRRGQKLVVRMFRGGRLRRARRLTVQPGPRRTGRFELGLSGDNPGWYRIKAAKSRSKWVHVLPASASAGDHGMHVLMLQRLLRAAHYVAPDNGVYDAATGRAVLALRKVTGMARTTSAPRAVYDVLLRGGGRFHPRYPSHGRHVEADLSRQIIALINPGGKVYRVYEVSSGKPTTPTVTGHFYFYRKDPGYNSEGMYYSSYFIRGYAVHGYYDVPTYAASHGCLRLPIPDAIPVYDWIRIGEPIDVYP